MARINDNFTKLAAGYLFPEIARRCEAFQAAHPETDIIRLGIGDVVLPLPKTIRSAMHAAIDELGTPEGFRGYGPYEGYAFLREAIARVDYGERGVAIAPDEIFVSDGSKCDSAQIQELFAPDVRLAIADPVYPVYVDTNVMAGRTGPADARGRYAGITYLPCTAENGFLPEPPGEPCDVVYLCSPNNPTGSVATHAALARWVDYARAHKSVLLFDAAYAAYIRDPSLPWSIFEISGARECAIEFQSYSKSAGFTGLRCAYVVIPQELAGLDAKGKAVSLRALWLRRQATKFNGASYPIQVAAAATYTAEGRAEVRANVDYYMENASLIRRGLADAGYTVYGGENAPYVWLRTPNGESSWDFFDAILQRAHVVSTPGSGFGACGEGYLRLSAFGTRERIAEAIARLRAL